MRNPPLQISGREGPLPLRQPPFPHVRKISQWPFPGRNAPVSEPTRWRAWCGRARRWTSWGAPCSGQANAGQQAKWTAGGNPELWIKMIIRIPTEEEIIWSRPHLSYICARLGYYVDPSLCNYWMPEEPRPSTRIWAQFVHFGVTHNMLLIHVLRYKRPINNLETSYKIKHNLNLRGGSCALVLRFEVHEKRLDPKPETPVQYSSGTTIVANSI